MTYPPLKRMTVTDGVIVENIAATTVTKNSSGVDLSSAANFKGVQGELLAILFCGAVTGTTPTLDVKFQESDTDVDANYADISGAAFPQVTASNKFHTIGVTVLGTRKKFIRARSVIAGTSPSFTYGISLVRGGVPVLPTA